MTVRFSSVKLPKGGNECCQCLRDSLDFSYDRWRHHRSPPSQFRHGTGEDGNILHSPALVISAATVHKIFGPTDLTSTYNAYVPRCVIAPCVVAIAITSNGGRKTGKLRMASVRRIEKVPGSNILASFSISSILESCKKLKGESSHVRGEPYLTFMLRVEIQPSKIPRKLTEHSRCATFAY
ncbi:hypothetical protein TNCV_3652821 [Trichonephila clavipes]|nr:hypothetical protein TNCV_3652821 [Trichonephila clavipes]